MRESVCLLLFVENKGIIPVVYKDSGSIVILSTIIFTSLNSIFPIREVINPYMVFSLYDILMLMFFPKLSLTLGDE